MSKEKLSETFCLNSYEQLIYYIYKRLIFSGLFNDKEKQELAKLTNDFLRLLKLKYRDLLMENTLND